MATVKPASKRVHYEDSEADVHIIDRGSADAIPAPPRGCHH
jgi:hypothetical protein